MLCFIFCSTGLVPAPGLLGGLAGSCGLAAALRQRLGVHSAYQLQLLQVRTFDLDGGSENNSDAFGGFVLFLDAKRWWKFCEIYRNIAKHGHNGYCSQATMCVCVIFYSVLRYCIYV